MSTDAFQRAIAEAEQLIRNPPFPISEQDLAEGLDYLAGSIRSSLQMAFDYDLEHPVLINPTHQYARQGLDNPDAIYFNAYLDSGASYVVSGVRGTTTDLSFQVMDGSYSDAGFPASVAAFDDRELEIGDDGSFEWRFGPELGVGKGATLIVREVYDDWNTEERGTLRIQRLDTAGVPRGALTTDRVDKRYGVAAKMLVGRIKTWFAFPEWFTYKEPVNTLTVPASTPGGLASQFSSIGHYSLADDEAMVVTVPACADAPYQAIQIGSRWYVSTDYEHHQTSLTRAQSYVRQDGLLRYVISERNPGVANWLEACGHPEGVMMLRWQRVARPLGADDGPRVEVVPFDSLATRGDLEDQRVTPDDYTARIEARQVGIARRMIS
ncbi:MULTISPECIES: hypothetical protein [unclassified Nocardioides]|uniref:hypothetical protein n=1 Tax=unclassified Nocardioides TaxID=2615069 RepID=UPI0006F662C0|nr:MULTISPECIES: hypothetical protein [unclassified Nocardioides]KQY57077.1 hypothetical protein ASD30_12510 [Nocardioides sp. Root140]KRF11717.1 hypothetical protein ASH02_17155 [Nocardioides sp. Soil796]